MVLNNKGFVVSALLYSILVLFIVLVVGILLMLSGRKVTVNKIKEEVINEIIETHFPEGFLSRYKDNSGASVPELSSGMIPIRWNENTWVKANVGEKWYDYNSKEWANAVLVTSDKRSTYQDAAPGTTIVEEDVLAYLVWIPRYKYQLFNVESSVTEAETINISFESRLTPKSTGSDNWLTHPAFTYGDKEIAGFWIGKFETTGTTNSPTVLPGKSAIRNINISAMWDTAKLFNNVDYGLSESINNVRVMKNTEWGAVAYLTNSIYGKNSEVWINNSEGYITGCSGSSAKAPLFSGTTDSGCEQDLTYDTEIGRNASTTGNIYGAYDMSGGSSEYVMASNAGMFGSSGFVTFPSSSNYDLYSNGTTFDDLTAYSRRILGDATGETHGWNDDFETFLYNDNPWLVRGGYNFYEEGAGVFAFRYSSGGPGTGNSFRIVLFGS